MSLSLDTSSHLSLPLNSHLTKLIIFSLCEILMHWFSGLFYPYIFGSFLSVDILSFPNWPVNIEHFFMFQS
jgi:hypothetical protein